MKYLKVFNVVSLHDLCWSESTEIFESYVGIHQHMTDKGISQGLLVVERLHGFARLRESAEVERTRVVFEHVADAGRERVEQTGAVFE